MVIAIVGSGGKTTLLKKTAAYYRALGKTVFVTTTTHMYREPDTLLTEDPEPILEQLHRQGYAMAGIPEGAKIRALPEETYLTVCSRADVVLVEADGSRQLPLKFPGPGEPVIPGNADEIWVVCGLRALGKPAGEVCHRLELVKQVLSVTEDTPITREHIRKLLTQGYFGPLRHAFPGIPVRLFPRAEDTPLQQETAAWLTEQIR